MVNNLRCVVGNCLQPDENVARYYWSIRSMAITEELLADRAYLDLCYFHSEVFVSRTVHTFIDGWDRTTD